jgi:tetratricopeptide (TPR) repeat protein
MNDLNRALALDPKLAETWSYRGFAWLAKRDFTRALEDFGEALKHNPRMANTYCIRGVARLAQGKLEEAEAEITRCRELGGDLKSKASALLQEMKQRRGAR